MARRLRYVPPGGALVEITCRTVQGRLLLRPSAILIEITLGILARAARLFGVAVHAYAFLSNHYHLLVSVADAQQLASFMNYFNSNLAREAGRLVRWREKFWGRRYQAILVSSEEEAQVGRLAYLLAHGVKEGLVGSPCDWPGAHCARALVEGKSVSGRWHNRTLDSRAQRKSLPVDPEAFVEREELTLAPLPCWQELEPEVYRARIREMIEEIEIDGRQRGEETGKQVRRALRRAYFGFLAAYRHAARPPPSGPPPRPAGRGSSFHVKISSFLPDLGARERHARGTGSGSSTDGRRGSPGPR